MSRQPNVLLKWDGSPWAHRYDVYLGTDPAGMTPIAANVELGPSQWQSDLRSVAVPGPLQSGTKYYWRVVGKTMANLTATSGLWTFTTETTEPPPPSLPAPWQSQDIGAVGVAGTARAPSATFTVQASGADVWGPPTRCIMCGRR